MDKQDKQFELEKQLHEQYAINNNERMSSLITLFVSLFVVIGAYGYMFLRTTSQSALDLGDIYLGSDTYTIDALLLTAAVCFIVIAIMQHLCIYQGAYQRKEQFIIHAIRIKNEMDMSIFPNGYTPLGKTRYNFVQGIYGELVKVFDSIQLILLFSTLWAFYELTKISTITYVNFVISMSAFCFSIIENQFFISKKYNEYKKIEIKSK